MKYENRKNQFILKTNFKKNYLNNNFSRILSKKYLENKNDISNEKKTLNVLNKRFKYNFSLNDIKRFKKYETIAVIGMGGSILGTEAIFNFFQNNIKKKIYFFDDIDEDKVVKFKKESNFKKILFFIISKSGNTIETLSNTFALKILKKNSKNIIIISEKNNVLFRIAQDLNLFFIEHKKNIGGRYSVLSEVGLIPAYLMGLKIENFRTQTQSFLNGKKQLILKENSLKLANMLNSKKFNSLIFLSYAPKLEKFLYWCQQLIAESLGKNNKGFLPIISNVPKDHHSLLQLYLDGPKDKIFNIFSFKEKAKIKIKTKTFIDKKFTVNNNTLSGIKNSQKNALIKSLKKRKIPFREFIIKGSDEKALGELFSYFILETVLIGKLVKINPFNQPAVEEVKIFTKKLLN